MIIFRWRLFVKCLSASGTEFHPWSAMDILIFTVSPVSFPCAKISCVCMWFFSVTKYTFCCTNCLPADLELSFPAFHPWGGLLMKVGINLWYCHFSLGLKGWVTQKILQVTWFPYNVMNIVKIQHTKYKIKCINHVSSSLIISNT